jgi:hypothetical protein
MSNGLLDTFLASKRPPDTVSKVLIPFRKKNIFGVRTSSGQNAKWQVLATWHFDPMMFCRNDLVLFFPLFFVFDRRLMTHIKVCDNNIRSQNKKSVKK